MYVLTSPFFLRSTVLRCTPISFTEETTVACFRGLDSCASIPDHLVEGAVPLILLGESRAMELAHTVFRD